MKAWEQFYPFIEPEVMGCPTTTIDHHLRLAARDFCERAGVWREWMDAFTADGTTNQFEYDLTGQQELVRVSRVLRDDDPLQVYGPEALPSDWQTGTALSFKDALVHYSDAEFMLFPKPTAGQVYRIELVLKPSITATGVGDMVYTGFAEDVATGAKARLMSMARVAWSDINQAVRYRREYERAVSDAANTGFARTAPSDRRVRQF